MRYSIRTRLALIMMAISAGIIIISILANSLLLEDYYMDSKKEALSEVYEELKVVVAELDDADAEDSTEEDAEKSEEETTGGEDTGTGDHGDIDIEDGSSVEADSQESWAAAGSLGIHLSVSKDSESATEKATQTAGKNTAEKDEATDEAAGNGSEAGSADSQAEDTEGSTADPGNNTDANAADSGNNADTDTGGEESGGSADGETGNGRQGTLSDEPFFLPDEVFSDFEEDDGSGKGFLSITGTDSEALTDEQRDKLNVACETNSVTLILVNLDGERIFSYGSGELLVQRLQQMAGSGAAYEENEVIEKTDDYTLHSVTDIGTGLQYLEMHGLIGNNYFVLRIAMESIQESVSISNQFYAIVGLIMIVVSSVIMWLVSRTFTEPIHRLAGIADQMAKLNFNVRYTGKQKDEVALLGNSMNEMADRLEESISKLKEANLELENDIAEKEKTDAMRQDFISNVSHELKTPIALIQGYAEGLKDAVNDDPESRDFYCDVIIDEAEKMSRMVKELLALTQIESGKSRVNIERFDIAAEIDGVLQANSLNIRQNEVTVYFNAEEPVYVWADQYQVEEVVTNYVSNALNHVNGEKVIRIQLEDTGDTIRVSVFNTGDGIPEEDIDRIWEKFYKVDKAHTREYGGNGIGLSIVKAIMENMHQDYGVENVPGGVVFWFEVDKKN